MASRRKSPVFRVTGLPVLPSDENLRDALESCIDANFEQDERSKITANIVIVPSCYDNEEKIALVAFLGGVPIFLTELINNPLANWQTEMGDTDVNFDQHFFGFTQLYTLQPDLPITAECVVLIGMEASN